MRRPEYISPTALNLYNKDEEEYYVRYLADSRPPRDPQTPAMAVGSAFDAFVKSYLHKEFYGVNHPESWKYVLERLFESQVDAPNRDTCWAAGSYIFQQYKQSGALADLMLELQSAVDEPRFEFEIRGSIRGARAPGIKSDVGDVVILGKPDIRFINNEGAHVILDWKVNGWFSKGNKSPMKEYVQLREQQDQSNWLRCGSHKDVFPVHHKGMMLNGASFLESLDRDWATQLASYAWLLGEPVGSETITGIDQIVVNNNKTVTGFDGKKEWPLLRIASHRTRIGQEFQARLLEQYQQLWNLIYEAPFYFFRDLSFEESCGKQKMLDERARVMFESPLSAEEQAIIDLCR